MATPHSPAPPAARLGGAVKRPRAGKLDEAAAAYAEVLAQAPQHADALHLSGRVAHQQGRHADAIAAIGRAIGRAPSVPDFHHSRGLAHRAAGDFAAAQADFSKASTLNPKYVEAWVNLGITHLQLNAPRPALTAFQHAAKLAPNSAEVLGYLGTAQLRLGQFDDALVHLKRAVALDPNFAEAHYNIGVAHERRGEARAAEAAWRRSIEANPFYLKPWNNLGVLLQNQRRNAEARACFERALSQAGPDARDTAELWNNFANVLDDLGEIEGSLQAYERAVNLAPQDARLQVNFGSGLMGIGHVQTALSHFAKGRELDPAHATAANCGLLGLLYAEDDPLAPLREASAWAAGLKPAAPVPHANSTEPARPLRIGYVSQDFCEHAVANFVEPVLAAHDSSAIAVFCYAEVKAPDDVTERFRKLVAEPHSDHWRDTVGLGDAELAAAIRADKIDILVDLAGHTVGSRLPVFAHKPAPIQVTWIGSAATTGVREIDWRITDSLADPPGQTESQFSEKLLRLPGGFNCYRPIPEAPEIGPLPPAANGHVTFGSFNHAAKIPPKVPDLSAEILALVPGSRLVLKHRGFNYPAVRRDYISGLERRGVPRSRFDLVDFIDGWRGHLAAYHRIDIAVDPFPYNGTTPTFQALWMGVPGVAPAGTRDPSRVGA